MSKISKWKSEKAKVKVVFRLQFHATHIPQSGWDKLFISFIPADSGKATAKTTKANVRNGTCKWADPIYETTRLLQDAKSKQYDEKLYKLVVGMGSSRASVLGETVINLAEYTDALKPSVVGLPLQGCNFGTILHVTVQLLTSKTGFREFEQQREQRDKGFQSGEKHEGSSPGKAAYLQEIAADQMDKVHARVKYTSDARELSSVDEMGSEDAESNGGFEGSSNTSGSLYTEKNDASINNEVDSLRSKASADMNGAFHRQSSPIHKEDPSNYQIVARGNIDPVHGQGSDFSMDNKLPIACEENNRIRGELDLAASSVSELKLEVSSLQRQTEEPSTETDNYSNILANELSSSKEMATEVLRLKSEFVHSKNDIERLKEVKSSLQLNTGENAHVELHHLLQNKQTHWIRGIGSIEDRIKELQSKVRLANHERDSTFLHSELDVLLHILQDLKHEAGDAIPFLNAASPKMHEANVASEISLRENNNFGSETGLEIEVCEPEIMLQQFTSPPVVSQVTESRSDIDAMKKNLFGLVKELDEAKIEREGLVRKMGEMECYYEALVQELEETQKQLMGELQNLRNEHSTCLYKLSNSKVEMESMCEGMTHQILLLTEERHDLDALNKELEKRAAASDAALKRARLNYSIAVNKLQKDLELLSSQVVCMFKTNETLIKQAFSEPPQPLYFGCPNIVQHSEESDVSKLLQLPSQSTSRKQQGREIFLDDLKNSLCLQEELYHKVEEELTDMHSLNLHLDIFSKALKETLSEASFELRRSKAQIEELEDQFRVSDESNNLLVARLQASINDVGNLREYNARCNAHYNDVALQNQMLEAKLESISNQNSLLLKEVEDHEEIMLQCRSYQSQYETCLAEKSKLSDLLAQESGLSLKIQNENSTLHEELATLKDKTFELISSRDYLADTVNFVQKQLAIILASHETQFPGLSLCNDACMGESKSLDCKAGLLLLEKIQHSACSKIVELIEENKKLENERLSADISLGSIRSEFLDMENKFKSNIHDIVTKLDASNAIVENLELKLESFSKRIMQSSEVGETHVKKHGELLEHLSILEAELQKLFGEDGHIVQEMSCLNAVSMELEMSQLTIGGLMQEKQDLLTILQDRTAESVKLKSDFCSLKENLRTLQDDLEAERDIRNNLQSTVGDLSSQLNMENNKIHELTLQNSELLHYKLQHAAKLELESSRVKDILLQRDELLGKLQAESASVPGLEIQLSEMLEHIVNEDVRSTFFTSVYEIRIEELEQKLICSDACFKELQKRHHEVEAIMKCSFAKESHYISEISKLEKDVESSRYELNNSLAQNAVLLETNETFVIELAEHKRKLEASEVRNSAEKDLHMFEATKWKTDLACAEEEIISLTLWKEQLEIMMLHLKCKLQEWNSFKKLLEESENELLASRGQCIELANLKNDLARKNDDIMVELNKHKGQLEALEVKVSEDKHQHINEATRFENSLASAEDEIFNLTLSKELLEITMIELCDKLQELDLCTSLLQENEKELMTLNARFAELSDEKVNLASLNEVIRCELAGCMKKLETVEASVSMDKDLHMNEAETLKKSLGNAEEEIIDLTVSKQLLGVAMNELKEHLEQQRVITRLLEESEKELVILRSQCIDLSSRNNSLQSANDVIMVELDGYKRKLEALEVQISEDEDQHKNEAEKLSNNLETAEKAIIDLSIWSELLKNSMSDLQVKLQASSSSMDSEDLESCENFVELSRLKVKLANADEEITSLTLYKEQLEITILVFKEKFREHLLEEREDQLMTLRSRCAELSCKLSEQTLKTEEYKTLSTHLKELQDKAVAGSQAAREKREPDVQPSGAQESLRMAFIKEQYETKLQELRQQLSISKKHGEEMLLKLQDSVDEIENRKRSEALHLKRNEEIALKLLGLEDELQSVLSDNRERTRAYDRIKAEYECAALSLECCKEEKELLHTSLQECEEEKSAMLAELSLTKKHLEDVASSLKSSKEESPLKDQVHCCLEKSTDIWTFTEEVESSSPDPMHQDEVSYVGGEAQTIQEEDGCCIPNGFSEHGVIGKDLQHTNDNHSSSFGSQDLNSSLMHLHDELEKIKKENFVIPEDQILGSEHLQKEFVRLDKANEELRSMFPLDTEISSKGNALERVLALEAELAETVRAKHKSKKNPQSAFDNQHGDEEAVLKRFRDINDLIKEMLELKGKHAAVETELRDMHDRFSQLSLQFAEVEGDRQKLKMILKNVRASRKLMQLNRSASAANAEVSS